MQGETTVFQVEGEPVEEKKYLWYYVLKWLLSVWQSDQNQVTPCPLPSLFLPLQIGNIKAETEITWFKDSLEILEGDEEAKQISAKDGVLTFDIAKVRRRHVFVKFKHRAF